MCLRNWLRWGIQQNVSIGPISVFLLLLFSMEQKIAISKGMVDPPLIDGNIHCCGDAKEELVGCASSYLWQAASTSAGASCEKPTTELPTFP